MTAYYNEFDPNAAAWLREIIKRNLIADGEVDERDLWDVHPDDLRGFTQIHLCAGIGVWSYALRRAGWDDSRPCCASCLEASSEGANDEDLRKLRKITVAPDGRIPPEILLPPMSVGGAAEGAENASSGAVASAASLRQPLLREVREGRREPPTPSRREPDEQLAGEHPDTVQVVSQHSPSCERCGATSDLYAVSVTGNRVPRLRGYGNAIVAPAATAFIESYLDARRTIDGQRVRLNEGVFA